MQILTTFVLLAQIQLFASALNLPLPVLLTPSTNGLQSDLTGQNLTAATLLK